MIFYGKGYVWDGSRVVPFVDGKLKTDNPVLIEKLKKAGYRSDDNGQTEQRNTEGQEAEAELEEKTWIELKDAAKEKGIAGYSRMKKADLIDALKEGE